MLFKNVDAVERFLARRPRTGTETADHRAFVMCKHVPIFIIFSTKSFDVIFTRLYGTLLWSLVLMSRHMGLQILEGSATISDFANAFGTFDIFGFEAFTVLGRTVRKA